MTAQSRRASLIEASVNTASGMVISFVTTQLLAPILDIQISYYANFILTLVLTCVSIARGYLWRRLFNKLHTRGESNDIQIMDSNRG